MKTGDVLKATLLENTGRHFMDSGGAYGRAWQENQGRDFASEPEAMIAEGAAFGVIWQDSTGVHCPLCGEVLEVW